MSNDFIAPENAPQASTAVVANEAEIQLPETAPARVGGGGGGARVQITTPKGQVVDRTTYIRALAKNNWTRGQINSHLKNECGDASIRYQTIFQVTKDLYPSRAEKAAGGGKPAGAAPEAPAVDEQEVNL